MIQKNSVLVFLAALFVIPTAASHAQVVQFEFIPGAFSANDMSPNGRFVVGELDFDGDGFPDVPYIYDTISEETTNLFGGLSATAVSDDGKVVLGDVPDPTGQGSNVAAIWTSATGWNSIGFLPNAGSCPSRSDGYELSADGSIAIGLSWDGCDGRGFIWSEATGMLELESLANGTNRASVISADGTLIGGFAQGSFSRTPSFWGDDTLGELLDPPSGDALGEVHGLRDDGTLMLGTWSPQDAGSQNATMWTLNGSNWDRETIASGSLLPGWSGIPTDIADDGTIVGFDFLLGNRRAWILPQGQGGLTLLADWIVDNGGELPDGFGAEVCQAISADGKIICGHGSLGSGGAWLVKVDPINVVVANTLTVFRGIQNAGEIADSYASDDSTLDFSPGFTVNNTEAPVWLVFNGNAFGEDVENLSFIVEAQAGTPGISRTTEIWNWSSGAYDLLDTADESFNSDSVVTVDLTMGMGDYILSGSNNLRSRVGWRRTGFTINFPWEVRLDRAVWQL